MKREEEKEVQHRPKPFSHDVKTVTFLAKFISLLVKYYKMSFVLKPLDPFGPEVHRFTNNLQGLQKAMVKHFS